MVDKSLYIFGKKAALAIATFPAAFPVPSLAVAMDAASVATWAGGARIAGAARLFVYSDSRMDLPAQRFGVWRLPRKRDACGEVGVTTAFTTSDDLAPLGLLFEKLGAIPTFANQIL